MGAVAGSGGYYVACPADVIVAQPATLTGSIGVLGGKVVVPTCSSASVSGPGMSSAVPPPRCTRCARGFTDDERDGWPRCSTASTPSSSRRSPTGRAMAYDAVHEVARGRIWSGADAAGNGLVDRLGGLRDAAAIARERAGLPRRRPGAPGRARSPPLARLGRPRPARTRARRAATVSAWGDLAGLAAELGLPAAGPLRMPSLRVR